MKTSDEQSWVRFKYADRERKENSKETWTLPTARTSFKYLKILGLLIFVISHLSSATDNALQELSLYKTIFYFRKLVKLMKIKYISVVDHYDLLLT